MRPEEMNDRGVEQLMIAMYVLAGNDLISAYRYKKEDQARAIERWLKNDTYGFISDYDGLIRAIKKKAKGKGWLKCPEFAKSEKFQERRADN
jgi:hypothetical protein